MKIGRSAVLLELPLLTLRQLLYALSVQVGSFLSLVRSGGTYKGWRQQRELVKPNVAWVQTRRRLGQVPAREERRHQPASLCSHSQCCVFLTTLLFLCRPRAERREVCHDEGKPQQQAKLERHQHQESWNSSTITKASSQASHRAYVTLTASNTNC